jgi:sterol desaturase/sphingolipid hydroxylase (fatty acid hydroxylase superfamily)
MLHNIVFLSLVISITLNTIGIFFSYFLLRRKDYFPRIQQRSYTIATLNKRMPLIYLNLAFLYILTYLGLTLTKTAFSWQSLPWWNILIQCVFLSLIDDFYFYFYHRTLHRNMWLFRKIHKIHHKAHSPLPIEYIYVHPLEWFIGAAGLVIGYLLLFFITGSLNCYVFLLYLTFRTVHELDIHSGINSFFANYIPFFASAEHHDLHHAKPTLGNYASTYLFWDKCLGTLASIRKNKKIRTHT